MTQARPTLLKKLKQAVAACQAGSDPRWSEVVILKPQQIKAKLIDAFHALPRGGVKHHLHVTLVVIQKHLPIKRLLTPGMEQPAAVPVASVQPGRGRRRSTAAQEPAGISGDTDDSSSEATASDLSELVAAADAALQRVQLE